MKTGNMAIMRSAEGALPHVDLVDALAVCVAIRQAEPDRRPERGVGGGNCLVDGDSYLSGPPVARTSKKLRRKLSASDARWAASVPDELATKLIVLDPLHLDGHTPRALAYVRRLARTAQELPAPSCRSGSRSRRRGRGRF